MQSHAKGLSTPFGPYLDNDILINPKVYNNPKATDSPEKRLTNLKWTLESFQLERNGELIGLNYFEDESPSSSSVHFRGVLQLRDIRHLTDQGRTWLIQELRNRGMDMSLSYYIKEHSLKVLVQGKIMFVPKHMIFPSTVLEVFSISNSEESISRKYTVISMHVITYYLSRSYLRRYWLVHEVQAICAEDGKLPKHHQAAIEDRTPSWLVKTYLKQCENRQGVGVHQRHIHKSEIYHLFGKHSTWLLGVFKKKKLLNATKWEEFCEEVKGRKRARRRGWSKAMISRRWGYGEHDSDVEDFVVRREQELRPEQVAQSSRQSVEILEPNYEASNYEEDNNLEEQPEFDPEFGYRHDREIIVTPPASELSDTDESSRSSSPVNYEILKKIPPELCKQPEIPHDFIWDCPVHDCSYTLNLHELTDEDLEGMLPDGQSYLKKKIWTLQNERFQDLFYNMTERHFYKHLKEMGIGVLAYKPVGRRQFESILLDKYTELPEKTKFKIERVKGSVTLL